MFSKGPGKTKQMMANFQILFLLLSAIVLVSDSIPVEEDLTLTRAEKLALDKVYT